MDAYITINEFTKIIPSQTQKTTLCLDTPPNTEITTYLSLSNDVNGNNTQIIFDECENEFEITYPNISIPITSTYQQQIFYTLPGESVEEPIICDMDASCIIICNNSVSCFLLIFTINTSITSIYCDGVYSCGSVDIFAMGDIIKTFESIVIECIAES